MPGAIGLFSSVVWPRSRLLGAIFPSTRTAQAMVSTLMSVVAGIERAKREGKAATLALLYMLAEREPIRPSDLSLELGAHPSSVTRQVQALEADGYALEPAPPRGRER